MGKYAEELRVNDNNSTDYYILNYVKPKSVVLEFGSADGRMTKYLKEELSCQVYIVEYTKEDFDVAIKYAVDGVCGDILDFLWLEQFSEISFDYIIFADVLEHLYNPSLVLREVYKLLKYDGTVIISVPNIAHDSIIIDLLNDEFQYHNTGLLDKTHIKFFTQKTLERMLNDCAFFPVEKYSTNLISSRTEFRNDYTEYQKSLDIIKNKKNGTVYQFVYMCKQIEYYRENKELLRIVDEIKKEKVEKSISVYYDDCGFSEENKVEVIPKVKLDNILSCEVYLPISVDKLRFDPLENEYCVLKNLKIFSNGEISTYINVNGFSMDDYEVFLYNDPQIIIQMKDLTDRVIIECERFVVKDQFTINLLEYLKNRMATKIEQNIGENSNLKRLGLLKTKLISGIFKADK